MVTTLITIAIVEAVAIIVMAFLLYNSSAENHARNALLNKLVTDQIEGEKARMQERKNLYDRLMAGTLPYYADYAERKAEPESTDDLPEVPVEQDPDEMSQEEYEAARVIAESGVVRILGPEM